MLDDTIWNLRLNILEVVFFMVCRFSILAFFSKLSQKKTDQTVSSFFIDDVLLFCFHCDTLFLQSFAQIVTQLFLIIIYLRREPKRKSEVCTRSHTLVTWFFTYPKITNVSSHKSYRTTFSICAFSLQKLTKFCSLHALTPCLSFPHDEIKVIHQTRVEQPLSFSNYCKWEAFSVVDCVQCRWQTKGLRGRAVRATITFKCRAFGKGAVNNYVYLLGLIRRKHEQDSNPLPLTHGEGF